MNDDGWHTILSAGVDRNILVYDNDAANGTFSKRLVSLMKTVMRRNGGGNSSSINRGQMTDMFLSPEGIEDIRNWGVDEVDPSGDSEIVVGLDLRNTDSFVMPVRQEVQIFEDDTLHRQRRAGLYGWAEHGFAVLDNRRVLLGSF